MNDENVAATIFLLASSLTQSIIATTDMSRVKSDSRLWPSQLVCESTLSLLSTLSLQEFVDHKQPKITILERLCDVWIVNLL